MLEAPKHPAAAANALPRVAAQASLDNAPAVATATGDAALAGVRESEGNLQLQQSVGGGSSAPDQSLHFMFRNESWVEVRDGLGKVVYSNLNAPGSERVVRGDPPFSLVIGGASGVQLSYNGSRVDLAAYATEDVARLRLE